MRRLEALQMAPAEIAAALELTLSDMISWLAGEMNPEHADVLEVALSLLEIEQRRHHRQNEATLRLRVA